MNSNAIYQKSAKGREAIANRQSGLAPKLRSTLILIDGKRGLGDLAPYAGSVEAAAQILAQLEAEGYVEVSFVAPPPPAPAAPAAPTPAPGASRAALQKAAVRKLTDAVGPMAEEICMRIEAAKSAADLDAGIARAENLLRQVKGDAAAEAYLAALAPYRAG